MVISWKITSGSKAVPKPPTALIIEVYIRPPGALKGAKLASGNPITRPLSPLPSIIPVSSILYRYWGGVFL